MVVSLESILDLNAIPDNFEEHYKIYKDLVKYIDGRYTENTSRTFIGKGSEGGVVIMALLQEDEKNQIFDNYIATDPSPKYTDIISTIIINNSFPKNKTQKRLHFSFTTSNDFKKCTKLISLFKEANYKWLNFESVYYKDNTYENAYPIAFSDGIKFIYSN